MYHFASRLASRWVVSRINLRVFHLSWEKTEDFHEISLPSDFGKEDYMCWTEYSIRNSKYYFKMHFSIKYYISLSNVIFLVENSLHHFKSYPSY